MKQLGTEKLLEVKDLKVNFEVGHNKIAKAVDGVSFFINKGETVALVGESGSGKSVTSLSIMRLIPIPPGKIVGGSIELDGQDLLSYTEKRMRKVRGEDIGMIFQEPMTSLDPVFRIENQLIESIIYHQRISKKEAKQRALELLKLVGIANPEKVLHEYPHQLSGGMRQRVMIAIAMSNNPKLLIADEPTTALDVTVQAQILKLMLKMKDTFNSSILLITHDMGVVAETADRVLVMYGGQIVEEAQVKELFLNPKHPYTAALLRTIPSLEQNMRRLPSIPGNVPPAHKFPKGCRFADRCEFAMDICKEVAPALDSISDGHQVRCHLHVNKSGSARIATYGLD
ncbi:ABC transporter ATP-binding protein [Oceanobacillus profundus]|uniref:ABC transporter ATP-binding protein n=1 Tax=Oceanobacillus TaxID=182709 RepID=UPI000BA78B2A|nr:ABC transporter ATP-binding protein [Oceanobacillus profundus]MBR3120618.1 ABC transporter ATP-binding protein [Oceanobacillus sp.]MCM3397483.1 ABC transporter ATP-binding protein [Oceanobacillus profundus]MDO6448621.1 ABC transporter ATP-binding protein [Oceanobacillus profundus]PAE28887.1 peptide ABC transporter ATP-binding protein [Paenibacillus sp. 7884-2]